jgi:glutamate-1-semialdehyde 2,1-aminomutase
MQSKNGGNNQSRNSPLLERLSGSLKFQERAIKRIPGMTQLLSKRPDMFSRGVWPGYYKKAKGARVWDLDGNEYLDMSISGIGANILGYADDDVDAAVIDSIRNGVSSSLNCPEEVELADLLCETHPWAEKVRFTRAGGESLAVAVRIARAYTGKDVVAFCGYHGWHDWYLAANISDDKNLNDHLLPGLHPAGVPRGLKGTSLPFNYNRLDELQAIFDQNSGKVGVVVLEAVRSQQPKDGFLEKVRNLVTKNGAVLIVDEVSSGYRITPGGAHLKYDLRPDIAVFAKAMGNGYPIGAIIGIGEVMDAAQKTFISSTNWTERVGPTAALATIRKYKKLNVHEHLIKIGTKVQEGWKKAAESSGMKIDVSGIPPLSHFGFQDGFQSEKKALFIQLMLEKGYLASNLLYVMYAHTEEMIDPYLAAVEESIEQMAKIEKSGDGFTASLLGMPAGAGFKRLT